MKKIIFLLLVISYLLFGVKGVLAEEIKSFEAKIFINKNGTINVSEKIVYDFGSLQRHGIYRIIPFIKPNKENKRYRLDFNAFSVQDETGKNYTFVKSVEGDKLKLKIGDADRYVTGLKNYIINYRVSGAITYFSDHDELYWNVTGNDWLVTINEAVVEVEFPQKIEENKIKNRCYTGYYGATQSLCQTSFDNRDNDREKLVIKTNSSLGYKEGLTIVLSFPKNIAAVLEAKEAVDFWQTVVGKFVILLIALGIIFWYVVYPIKIIFKWWRYGRDPKGQVQEVRAWFDPPKLKNGRAMTPTEVGSLIDEIVDLRDISASIVDLARRGYLKIEERKKNDFYLIKTKNDNHGLQPFEKKLLEGIFGDKDIARLKDKHLAKTVEEASNLVYDQLVTEGFFPKNPNATRIFYSIIGVLALISGNLGLALIAFTFGRAMPAKTIFGVEAANISKSLKNFLTSQERQLAFQAKNQQLFEKLLPYAVAFGVERIWAERFRDINLKPPEWYTSYGSTRAFNSLVFTKSLSSSMSSFRSAATPVTSTTGHVSGFGGGGFSGGGGGGGGGGSW